MIYDIAFALFKLAPGARWIHRGEPMDYAGIEWDDTDIARPTDNELQAVIDSMDAAEPMRLLRLERDQRLAATDWWAMPDRIITPEQTAYRTALRDLPESATPTLLANGDLDLNSVNWPIKP